MILTSGPIPMTRLLTLDFVHMDKQYRTLMLKNYACDTASVQHGKIVSEKRTCFPVKETIVKFEFY